MAFAACSSPATFAPVSQACHERSRPGYHWVKAGDTLYTIAWRYEVDVHHLAACNHLRHPQDLRAGRWLQLCRARKLSKSSHKLSNLTVLRQSRAKKRWQWPAKGTIIKRFSLPKRQKGIDIASMLRAPVRASYAGKVAYAGDGIPGYGKLLIIKHDDHYLSAYAHNLKLVVKEGQRVDAGQVIARVGYLRRRKPGLHFEIRQYGRPIDPLRYLKQRRNRGATSVG